MSIVVMCCLCNRLCHSYITYLLLPDLQFDELEELGFIGFSLAFFEEKSQIVGTSSTLQCFTPQLVEYLHAVLITGRLSDHCIKVHLLIIVVVILQQTLLP